jgi:hypothetical protein
MRGGKEWRVTFLVSLVAGGMVIAMGFHAVMGVGLRLGYPHDSFLYAPQDRFMDFFNVNAVSADRDPYPKGTPYPPVALLVAHAFSRGFDYPAHGPFAARESAAGAASLVTLTVAFAAVLFAVVYPAVRTGHRRRDVAATLILGASYPVLFLVDRGNYAMLAFAFLYGFAHFARSNRPLANLCLALAISMKLYPVVFLGLYLAERRWKDVLTVAALTAGLNLAALLCFKQPILVGLREFVENVGAFSGGYGQPVLDSDWNVSLTNLFRLPVGLLSPRYEGQWALPSRVLSLAVLCGLGWYLWVERTYWKRTLALTACMIGLPGSSPDYTLIYLFIPLSFYLREAEGVSRLDYVLLTCLAMLFVPKTYYVLAAFREHALTVQALLNPLILFVLFAALLVAAPRRLWRAAPAGPRMIHRPLPALSVVATRAAVPAEGRGAAGPVEGGRVGNPSYEHEAV